MNRSLLEAAPASVWPRPTIELVRFIPGRVGVLSQITHVDNDPEAAKEKAKRFLMETKVANAARVRLLNADGVEVFNWGPDH